MSELLNHYKKEIKILRKGLDQNDELIIEPYNKTIESLIKKFSEKNYTFGEAGFTINVLAQTIKAALGFQILSPLDGSKKEWGEKKENVYPNLRDSGVFKDEEGTAYYNKAIVWIDPVNEQKFTGTVNGVTSFQKIKEFPFMPKSFYIEVELTDYTDEYKDDPVVDFQGKKLVYVIKNKKDLEQVFEFYNK